LMVTDAVTQTHFGNQGTAMNICICTWKKNTHVV